MAFSLPRFVHVQANLRVHGGMGLGVSRRADTVQGQSAVTRQAGVGGGREEQRNRIGELDETFPFRLNWRLRD